VRAVNLDTREVETLAGTGEPARIGQPGGPARRVALNSPWDLACRPPLLFVAMAGLHQIWVLELTNRFLVPYVGSGQEARVDGGADDSAFAQPSGLAVDDNILYVADAESNVIRAVTLPPDNRVRTLAGGNLFDFGDVDGSGDEVRLQHPLGVAVVDGEVAIADTYNHRIKILDPRTRLVRRLAGSGLAGFSDGPAAEARFSEPGGLSAAEGACSWPTPAIMRFASSI
jgi:hypothetical protein